MSSICPWHKAYADLAIRRDNEKLNKERKQRKMSTLQRLMLSSRLDHKPDGFDRIDKCREALCALDNSGWKRSFHQRQFHEAYIRACARVFFKTDGTAAFMQKQQKLLELNGWECIAQEVLVSTPRRFGKTISISMFAAALIFSCPSVECSIYSTCKRISTKLLRMVLRFLNLIHEKMDIPKYKELRLNQEEIMLLGPEGAEDIRVINSYPSRVSHSSHKWGSGILGFDWECLVDYCCGLLWIIWGSIANVLWIIV
jgi:hypothetical protein